MANFKKAFERTMRWEGIHSDDPADKGGETYYGISRVNHPEVQPWPPTREQAEAFYKRQYWDVNRLDEIISDRVAWKIFDIGVNMGVKIAARFAQNIGSVIMDGIIGLKTLEAINKMDERLMLTRLLTMQRERYAAIATRDPSQRKFINGWLRRAADIAEDWT